MQTETGLPTRDRLNQLVADLETLAASIRDNAPDMEDDYEIAEEYELLTAVHRTIHASIAYFEPTAT